MKENKKEEILDYLKWSGKNSGEIESIKYISKWIKNLNEKLNVWWKIIKYKIV